MNTNDLQMTRDGDLCIAGNDILTTDSIEQGIFIRLRWWWNEWKFGPRFGVKYFEHVLVKNPDKLLMISDIREQLLNVEGVKAVEHIDVGVSHKDRTALIRYTVTTESLERLEREVAIWNMA